MVSISNTSEFGYLRDGTNVEILTRMVLLEVHIQEAKQTWKGSESAGNGIRMAWPMKVRP